MTFMSRYLVSLLVLSLLLIQAACKRDDPTKDPGPDTSAIGKTGPPAVPEYGYEVVNSWPHDTSAFTQGLLFHNGFLYESTGLEGESSLRKVNIENGEVVKRVDLAPVIFAEGLARFNDRLYQISWRNAIGIVYDLESFKELRRFTYYGEGWGLTSDSSALIMSDGSAFLRFLDPDSLKVRRTITVQNGSTTQDKLNELEYVKGEIYANVWTKDEILRIDPATGDVRGIIDMRGILPPQDRDPNIDVLNGIAYDPATDRLWVTGKKWPRLFEIRLKPKPRVVASVR